MIGEPSVQRISVGSAVEEWWDAELARFHDDTRDQGGDRRIDSGRETNQTQEVTEEGNPDVTRRGDGSRSADQWGGTLPGHGGT